MLKESSAILKWELESGQWDNEFAVVFWPSLKQMKIGFVNQRAGVLILPDQWNECSFCCQNYADYPGTRGGTGHPVWEMREDFFCDFVVWMQGLLFLVLISKQTLQNMVTTLLKWNTVMGILGTDLEAICLPRRYGYLTFMPWTHTGREEFTLEGGGSVENGAKHRKSKFASRREQLLEANSILPVYVGMC